jgi:large subunit ribosomal protein L6
VQVEDGRVQCERPTDGREHRSLHGLTRSLIANMVTGVSQGYRKELELVGVGYRAQKQGEDLQLNLGYSHPVRVTPPKGITIEVADPTHFAVTGIDKELVGQLAADIRKIRPPEPYKGKGVLYRGERVRRKAGKAGKGSR